MDLKATSFFGNSEKNARVIQNLRENLFVFLEEVISLDHAKSLSCMDLQRLISEERTLEQTKELFLHLERFKNLIIPSREPLNSNFKTTKSFLSAYLFATNPESISEGSNEADENIIKQSKKMIKIFEKISNLMKHIDSKENLTQSEADKILLIRSEKYIKEFHRAQLAYEESFVNWDEQNVRNLVNSLIHKYLQIESEKRAILLNADPRKLSLYTGYKTQQTAIKERLHDLFGEKGLDELEEALEQNEKTLEESKWFSVSPDVLLHELYLHPNFEFSEKAFSFKSEYDIKSALEALKNDPEQNELIFNVFSEIRLQLTLLKPKSIPWTEGLQGLRKMFEKENLQAAIAEKGVKSVLLTTTYVALEIIKHLEAPAEVPSTEAMQKQLQEALESEGIEPWERLEKSIKLIHAKFSEIQTGMNAFKVDFLRGLPHPEVLERERAQFKKRVSGKQFAHRHVLAWLEDIIKSPNHYRFDRPVLFSDHVGEYIARAIVIGMIETPGKFAFLKVPETFYLDKLRMHHWHNEYQKIFFTLASLGFLETFSQKYGVRLSEAESLQQKERLLAFLRETGTEDPKPVSSFVLAMLCEQLSEHDKQINREDMSKLPVTLERIYTEKNHPVTKLLRQRLSDQLNYYLRNGHLQDANTHLEKLHGLQNELSKLGKSIQPALDLHTQVHATFYKEHIEARLWKDFFQVLQQHNRPKAFPPLLAIKQNAITSVHRRIHRLGFVITGLGLLQQTVVYQDQWNLNAGFKYPELKDLAQTHGLIQMINDESVSADDIEKRILELINKVVSEQNLEQWGVDKIEKMVRLAKEGHSLGYRGVVRSLVGFCEKTITTGKLANINVGSNRLVAEFAYEIEQIAKDAQEITLDIKHEHLPEDVSVDRYAIPDIDWEPGKCGNQFGL